jgi:hypothetical protein
MEAKWKPYMTPDEYRKYEVDLALKGIKPSIGSGLGIALIDKKGFLEYPVELHLTLNKHNANISNKIIAFCQIILFDKKDADQINSNKMLIYNKKSIVIVGYLNEYNGFSGEKKWSPCKSMREAYNYFNNPNVHIGFHGTNVNVAKKIKQTGFRDLKFLEATNTPANYFTPNIWYAYNWAHFKGQKGVILVCLLSFKNPIKSIKFVRYFKL